MLRRVPLIAGLGLALASTPALAKPHVHKGSFELGLQLGGLYFLDKDAVPFDVDGSGFPDRLVHTFAYTLHAGYNFNSALGLELALQASPAEDNRVNFYTAHLDLVWNMIQHDWIVPFIGIGPSVSVLVPQGDYATDIDPAANAMLGVKLYARDWLGFRVDARYIARFPTSDDAADGRSEVMGHDLVASFGIFGNFGASTEEPVVLLDSDSDGILDHEDLCPTEKGPLATQGCPDRDGDGLADAKDRCPDNAGPLELLGCPDRDGDGLVDIDDRCPDEAGPAEYVGCPDRDGDGIPDKDDRCPRIPGVAEHRGCPPPPPQEVVKRFTGKMEGITFQKNKDVIRPSSFPTLDEAVDVMKNYPQMRLRIEGHTSSEGRREANVDLSERRANAVKTYMLEKGIEADRIDTIGHGPDKPVAPNNNERNREKNRRIEFALVQPE